MASSFSNSLFVLLALAAAALCNNFCSCSWLLLLSATAIQSPKVTAEDEAGIHVWDLRMSNIPVQDLPGHAHWTWTVKYNPEYEEMILSAGTDSAVNLWSVSAFNSNEATPESLPESPTRQVDPLLNSFSDYEDSVYGLAWSSRQPWIFASLSYDGRVVVESVKPYIRRN